MMVDQSISLYSDSPTLINGETIGPLTDAVVDCPLIRGETIGPMLTESPGCTLITGETIGPSADVSVTVATPSSSGLVATTLRACIVTNPLAGGEMGAV